LVSVLCPYSTILISLLEREMKSSAEVYKYGKSFFNETPDLDVTIDILEV
jgi:hypothetical protein